MKKRKPRRWVQAVIIILAGAIMALALTSCMISAHYQTLERVENYE
jgi:hypothetical protein|nr:MAG TPA: hypothetical protein [Caudoviricetes sp.]